MNQISISNSLFQGSCFPASFGGRCSGTPAECQSCNTVVQCGEDGRAPVIPVTYPPTPLTTVRPTPPPPPVRPTQTPPPPPPPPIQTIRPSPPPHSELDNLCPCDIASIPPSTFVDSDPEGECIKKPVAAVPVNVTDVKISKLSNNPELDLERKENLVEIAETIMNEKVQAILGETLSKQAQEQIGDLVELYKSYNEIEPPFDPVKFDPTPDPYFDVLTFDLPVEEAANTTTTTTNTTTTTTTSSPFIDITNTNIECKTQTVTTNDGRVICLPPGINIARRRRRQAGSSVEDKSKVRMKEKLVEETDYVVASLEELSQNLKEEVELLEGKIRYNKKLFTKSFSSFFSYLLELTNLFISFVLVKAVFRQREPLSTNLRFIWKASINKSKQQKTPKKLMTWQNF